MDLGGWEYFSEPDEAIPLDDLRPHIFGCNCWCNPEMIFDTIAHRALDQREEYEHGKIGLH